MNNWKILHLDLNEGELSQEDWEPAGRYPGGRGFTSRWLLDNIPADCDPLGVENCLIFATGALGGSGASSSTRLSIGGKSPLTGGIKESNTGGKAGAALVQLGVRALILQGSLDQLSIIFINKEGFQTRPCPELAGKDIYYTTAALRDEYGKAAACLAIGPAGEMGLSAAAIGVSDNEGIPARHAARGGLGAVMGAKKIKALVIDTSGGEQPTAMNLEKLKKSRRRFNKAIVENGTTGEVLPKYGTAVIVNIVNNIAGLPTRNFSEGVFERAEEISGESLHDLIVERGGKPTHACLPGCAIRCSNVVPAEEGGELNRALEYETITLLGSNLGIDDLDLINKLNKRCDEIGVDTIDVGAAIGVAMEAGLADFGDGEAALKFMDAIEKGTDLGKTLGSGAQATGEKYGVERIPTVKRQAMAAYDPRALKGTGVTYATSPMGADHTAGNALPNSKLPDGSAPDTTKAEHQVELSIYMQQIAMILDTMGLCWFTRPPILEDITLVTELLEAMYGDTVAVEQLFAQARDTLADECEFNRLAGLNEKNDLPAFFREEPLAPKGYLFDVEQRELDRLEWMGFKEK